MVFRIGGPSSLPGSLMVLLATMCGLAVCRAIHAEQMAITNAANEGSSLKDCTMYCNAEPCLICAKMLTNIELEAVVILEGGYSNTEGLDVVMSAGIPVRAVRRKWLHTGE
jgi:dCMP deaminase